MKKIILSLLLCFYFWVGPVYAIEKNTSSLKEEVEIVEKEEKLNLFENFYYRLFEKDTKDFFDYSLMGVFIVGLLIVMVLQNTHYTVVKNQKETKLVLVEAPVVEEKLEEKETLVETVEEKIEPSEILPSELLEEDVPKVEQQRHKKKKRH